MRLILLLLLAVGCTSPVCRTAGDAAMEYRVANGRTNYLSSEPRATLLQCLGYDVTHCANLKTDVARRRCLSDAD